MLTYTLRQLEYFTAAADCGSVAGAAATLNVSQPSVSNAILKLEDHFGVQLFVRHHAQGVSLTPVGHRILADARNLLRHANDLQHNARAAGDVMQGGLELGCFITLAPSFISLSFAAGVTSQSARSGRTKETGWLRSDSWTAR